MKSEYQKVLCESEYNLLLDNIEEPKSASDKLNQGGLLDFGNCLNPPIPVEFSSDDMRVFYKLAKMSDVLFSEEITDHQEFLKTLYSIVFKETESDIEKIITNNKWITMGFQNNRPSTDFRGGGLLSLKSLINFCSNERELLDDIIYFTKKNENFIFSCVLIGAVFFLKRFFHFGV